jgi:ABC-type sugar transport system permease subunit
LQEAAEQGQLQEVQAYLSNLETVLAPMTRRVLWAREPWSFVEILFRALAGVIVNLIVKSGSYLRWHRFYREGLFLHWAQFFTAPIVVVVLVFLLSTVKFTIAVGGAGDVTLDLSDPRMLAAASFLLGVLPWGAWDALQKAAGRLTGQVTDESSDVAQKRK